MLMRPTLNSRGHFVKRSICGSPKVLETSLMHKDTFKDLKHSIKRTLAAKEKRDRGFSVGSSSN